MEESYPAIDRVLDLLRLRLNVDGSCRKNRFEETTISVDSLGDDGSLLKDKGFCEPEAHQASEVYNQSMIDERIPTTSSRLKKSVFSLRKIKSLISRDLEIALEHDNEMQRKLKLRRQLIDKINPSFRIASTKPSHELFMVFSQWKECFLNKKKVRASLYKRSIVDFTNRCSFQFYLPEKQQHACVEKYGKKRLAALFHTWKTKRKVFGGLVKSYLAVKRSHAEPTNRLKVPINLI